MITLKEIIFEDSNTRLFIEKRGDEIELFDKRKQPICLISKTELPEFIHTLETIFQEQ